MGAGSYTTENTSGGFKFSASTVSEDDGQIVWEGVVRGGKIEAIYT